MLAEAGEPFAEGARGGVVQPESVLNLVQVRAFYCHPAGWPIEEERDGKLVAFGERVFGLSERAFLPNSGEAQGESSDDDGGRNEKHR